MSFYDALGWFVIAFTSAIGAAVLAYCTWRGARNLTRQIVRGKFEEDLDIKDAVEQRYLERMIAK